MGKSSKIEWTDLAWNPMTGCTKVSPGCDRCYAEMAARRLRGRGFGEYRNGFGVTLHEHKVFMPLNLKKPKRIFVNSMGDLFHEAVPLSFLRRVFDVMNQAAQHTFQVMTKRSARMADLSREFSWTPNIWAGVSVENQGHLFRIDHLRAVPAAVRFVAFEPLLGQMQNLDLSGIHWVIVGGESGKGARTMDPDWVRGIVTQATALNIPLIFKQWSQDHRRRFCRTLDGKVWEQIPA